MLAGEGGNPAVSGQRISFSLLQSLTRSLMKMTVLSSFGFFVFSNWLFEWFKCGSPGLSFMVGFSCSSVTRGICLVFICFRDHKQLTLMKLQASPLRAQINICRFLTLRINHNSNQKCIMYRRILWVGFRQISNKGKFVTGYFSLKCQVNKSSPFCVFCYNRFAFLSEKLFCFQTGLSQQTY